MATNQPQTVIAPLMRTETREDRARVVRDLSGSWAIEGQDPTPAEAVRYRDYIDGKISVEELVAAAKAG